jgi:hypothetical protein
MLASMLFLYGFGGLILLALTFALHLGIRAYWVALIGMNSVFPNGIKFEAIKGGPLAKALLARRWRSLDDSIERADNAATIVFGIGVSIVLVLVPVSLTVTLMFAFATLLGWAVGLQQHTSSILMGMMALMFVPYMVLTIVDQQRGQKLVPGSLAHRLCEAGLAFYGKVGMSRAANPLATLFSTNVGERRGQAIMVVVMLVAMLSSVAGLVLSRKDLGFGSYGGFPDPRRGMSSSVEGRSYATTHEPDWSPVTPFLPDLVVRGDYLRLVVPYIPKFDVPLYEACGAGSGSAKADEERKRRAELLVCVSRSVRVSLDGEAIAIQPEWYTEPGRDLRGLLYMIPARGLKDGRHEVAVLPTPKETPKDGDEPEQPFVIPFWR